MKSFSPVLLLGAALLLGLGLGAGGMYVARPLIEARAPEAPPSAVAPVAPAAQTGAPPPTEAPAVSSPAPAPSAPLVEPATPPSPVPPPQARPAPEADRALEGVKKGEFQPLETITAMLGERFPGQILGVKLSEDDGIHYYEFKILTRAGRLLEVEVDPRSGRVIEVDEDDD